MDWLAGCPTGVGAAAFGAAASEFAGLGVCRLPNGRGAAGMEEVPAEPGSVTAPAKPEGCCGPSALSIARIPIAISIAQAAVRPNAGARRGGTGGIVPRKWVTARLHSHSESFRAL